MYLAGKTNEQVEKCLHECKLVLNELALLSTLGAQPELVISGQKTLYSKTPRDGSIYIVKEGSLKCVKDEKILYYVEEGDVIGFEGSAFDESMDFLAEFAVVIVKIDPAEVFKNEKSVQLWNRFQGNFINAILHNASSSTKSDTLFSPEIRNFEAGENIVEQGSMGDEIFSLIDGVAEIIVDGGAVGEVLPDQLFGAVSVLSNSERIATIRALTDCMVLVLSKEQFLTLIDTKPDTILKLAEELSRAIVSVNDQVNGLVKIPG